MTRGKKPIPDGERKRAISAFLEPDVYERVKGLAAEEDVSLSEAVNALLKRAVMHRDTGRWYDLFGPAVEAVIIREIRSMSNRLSTLTARTALEATAAREMVRNELMLTYAQMYPDATPEEVRERVNAVRERAWSHAVADLKKPAQGVREIIGNIDGK